MFYDYPNLSSTILSKKEFVPELEATLNKHNIKIGNVLRRPIDGLIAYHVLNK